MATIEQRDKRVSVRKARVEKAQPRLDKLNETVKTYDEKAAARRAKLTDRRDKLAARVGKLNSEIAWFEAMPVDGIADDEADEPTDENDEIDSPNAAGPVDDDGNAIETETHTADEHDVVPGARRVNGRFVSANASV